SAWQRKPRLAASYGARGDAMSEKQDHDVNYEELSGDPGRKKVAELVKGIRIAMMTTSAKDGTMSSRPMAVQDVPFDGILWFLTRDSSEKVEEIANDRHVTLAFADPGSSKYIALKGRASTSKDKAKIHELWSPMYKMWFPKGEDDPQITVLRVDVTEGDFWEASGGKLVQMVKYAYVAATGAKVELGSAGHVTG
ncbi:MAG: pyridoxamine 5'-phosphate oxidase family protein, partial [Bryocella sp.]